jgi:hypothetical protein
VQIDRQTPTLPACLPACTPRVLRAGAGGVAISCCCCWPFGCCHVHTHALSAQHSRIARLVAKVEGRSLSAMALFITVSMPADGRAHRDEREGATIFISMLQQLPHHRRIICTRKYTMARTCKPRLICLWPSAATITTMTTRRTPAASNVGQGCVTTGVCHGTRGDTIRSDQTDSALGEDLFPACFATRSTVHTTIPVSPPSARVGSTALRDRKGGECVVAVNCLLPLARATTFRPTVYLTVAATLFALALPRYC